MLSPVLDAFQTIPSVTYVIPFVMIFDVGMVPGIIASVIYAFAAGVRVTALGIKQVPEVTVEAATTFGATDRQLLWGVRIPLALSAIMLAVNQLILMTIAMVIIVGLNGGGALGYKLVESFQRQLIGQGRGGGAGPDADGDGARSPDAGARRPLPAPVRARLTAACASSRGHDARAARPLEFPTVPDAEPTPPAIPPATDRACRGGPAAS